MTYVVGKIEKYWTATLRIRSVRSDSDLFRHSERSEESLETLLEQILWLKPQYDKFSHSERSEESWKKINENGFFRIKPSE